MKQFLGFLWNVFAMVMMLIGISGLAFHVFQKDGWLQKSLGVVWDGAFEHPLLYIPLIALAIWIVTLTLNGRLMVGKTSWISDTLVFLMMFAGIYFTYEFLSAWLGGSPA